MSNERKMNRGKAQALYKYLPEEWIDFSVRGSERKQYIARVDLWRSDKLEGINAKRLLRKVSSYVDCFKKQGIGGNPALPPVVGFGNGLTIENCDVRTPRTSDQDSSIVAKISPLTFYCKKCSRVFQFTSEEKYNRLRKCPDCGDAELAQLRQIYFCKCGYATDKHPVFCNVHGSKRIKWDGKYRFYCAVPGCNKKIDMIAKCKVCDSVLVPKVALDPSQFFPFSFNLIDLIDEKLEDFIDSKDYGKYITIAYWLNKITREELYEVIDKGITTECDEYNKVFEKNLELLKAIITEEKARREAAKAMADNSCGNEYLSKVDDIKSSLVTTLENVKNIAEMIHEYDKVKNLNDIATLDKAIEVAKLLNTNATPEEFKTKAMRYGITDAQACDKIPFISCTYGYTRVKSEYEEGVQLHALKPEMGGRKNVYATKMSTEGVLFELDRKKILQWLLKNGWIKEENMPDLSSEEEVKLWYLNNIKPNIIQKFIGISEAESPETYYVYRLIHSISHLLIKAVASIGGLGEDSLSEYIFPNIPAVLVYCQNSQGFSLGSLFNTFEAYFDNWLDKAFEFASKCVFDPICIERQKACTGCLFLNEISCEHNNKDLDRSLLIGHFDKRTKSTIHGFWECED